VCVQLREIFKQAALNAPSLIFFDEIDALAPGREQAHPPIFPFLSHLPNCSFFVF
jgi:SpoVK/Ycf46/Vps4 family AAA+-type ATPase